MNLNLLLPIAFLVLVGWLFLLRRDGLRARAIVMASVPVGGLLGGFLGGGLYSAVLHFQGKGESHNDLIAFAAAGVLGMLIGGIALPAIAFFLTRSKKR